uniref:Putative secreted peptide n=1 Tax=Hyalomma excavatum TaxID=257692 RepID=A0A131XA91_9ACAR
MKCAFLLAIAALLVLGTSVGTQGSSLVAERRTDCDCTSAEAKVACPGRCACWARGDWNTECVEKPY